MQVITSRDLAVEVIKALDLTNNPAFAKDAGMNVVGRFLRSLGLGRGSERSEEEKAANTFAEHLSIFPLAKSSVIAIDYTSGDLGLAAQIANKLADVYIAWQREAALEQTKDATAWLSAQIDVLRPRWPRRKPPSSNSKLAKACSPGAITSHSMPSSSPR